MSELSEMVKAQSSKILKLERELAEQTRRANVAEAWQRRLTSLLANRQCIEPKCDSPELCNDLGDCDSKLIAVSAVSSQHSQGE